MRKCSKLALRENLCYSCECYTKEFKKGFIKDMCNEKLIEGKEKYQTDKQKTICSNYSMNFYTRQIRKQNEEYQMEMMKKFRQKSNPQNKIQLSNTYGEMKTDVESPFDNEKMIGRIFNQELEKQELQKHQNQMSSSELMELYSKLQNFKVIHDKDNELIIEHIQNIVYRQIVDNLK